MHDNTQHNYVNICGTSGIAVCIYTNYDSIHICNCLQSRLGMLAT